LKRLRDGDEFLSDAYDYGTDEENKGEMQEFVLLR
jgi:hypothetical protein